jgi:hypothetical protein
VDGWEGVAGVVMVRLGRGLRSPPPDLSLQLMSSQAFQELLKHTGNPRADLNAVRELVSKVNEDLEPKGYRIVLAKAPPQSRYDYILRLTRKR